MHSATLNDRKEWQTSERLLLPTPFHLRTAQANSENRWTRWGDFTVAEQYTTVNDEYFALHNRVVLADLSPLFKYVFTGADARAFLSRLIFQKPLPTAGTAKLVLLCDDDGNVISDGVLVGLSSDEFRLTTEVPILSWLADSLAGFDVVLTDVTRSFGILAIAGPQAEALLSKAGFDAIESLSCFNVQTYVVNAIAVTVLRTASLGVPCFELWLAPEDALVVWDRLWRFGAAFGLGVAGMTTMDSCRLENGLTRAGRDYGHREYGHGEAGPLLSPAGLTQHFTPPTHGGFFIARMTCLQTGRHTLIGTEIGGVPTGMITSQIFSTKLQCMIANVFLPVSAQTSDITFVVWDQQEGRSFPVRVKAALRNVPVGRL